LDIVFIYSPSIVINIHVLDLHNVLTVFRGIFHLLLAPLHHKGGLSWPIKKIKMIKTDGIKLPMHLCCKFNWGIMKYTLENKNGAI